MGKAEAPPPPDFSPFIAASQSTSAADAHAADLQYQLGQQQLEAQTRFADSSAARGDQYYQMALNSQQFGQDQFNKIWPYAQEYLRQQNQEGVLAGQFASEQVQMARQQREQAAEQYGRYMNTFVPMENQFAQFAANYNTPARAAQASAGAQADVATSYGAQAEAASQELRSYGIDPSQGRYQGQQAIMAAQQAAASAAAGTQARRASELTGAGLQQQAIAVGQHLPTVALGQIAAGTTGGAAGLQAGQYGGGGVTGASSALQVGSQAIGSPTGYAALGNPYTSLAGTGASLAGGLFGSGNQALGNAGQAIGIGASAAQNSFSDQMQIANFNANQSNQFSQGLGQFAGLGLSAALRFSDRRLKTDIKQVGALDGGLPVYAYRYKGEKEKQLGVMADDVEKVMPEAVLPDWRGYKQVDYNQVLS